MSYNFTLTDTIMQTIHYSYLLLLQIYIAIYDIFLDQKYYNFLVNIRFNMYFRDRYL